MKIETTKNIEEYDINKLIITAETYNERQIIAKWYQQIISHISNLNLNLNSNKSSNKKKS